MLLPPEPVTTLDAYFATEYGGLGLQRAVELGPEETIATIEASGLRGRGGAGFPTGVKWRSVSRQPGSRRFVVANGAEGEPGTFKDRALLRANPYQVVEGVFIAGFAIGAEESFIALKSSFHEERDAVVRAIQEMQAAGLCTDCQVTVVDGPDEYLFGEEKALLEVIEGKPPLPRLLPPHEHGLFAMAPQMGWEATGARRSGVGESNPTLANNVETLANVPQIVARGAPWFRSQGTAASPGTQICTVVGDVVRPSVGELPLGTPLRTVIDQVGGGLPAGRSVKAVFSGVANPLLTGEQLDVPLTYEDMEAAGSGMGAAGFIVFDDTACMVDVAHVFSRFLYVESCGQCPACKRGSGEITTLLARLDAGVGSDDDIAQLGAWLDKVTDGNRCYLAVEEQQVVASVLRAFPDEVASHVEQGRCPRPRRVPLPKLVDLRDGTAVLDERQARKRPDWTYEPATTA